MHGNLCKSRVIKERFLNLLNSSSFHSVKEANGDADDDSLLSK